MQNSNLWKIGVNFLLLVSLFAINLTPGMAQGVPPEVQPFTLTGETAVGLMPVQLNATTYQLYYFTQKSDFQRPLGDIFYDKSFLGASVWLKETGITGLLVLDSAGKPITDADLLRSIFMAEMGGYMLFNLEQPELFEVSQGEIDEAAKASAKISVQAGFFDHSVISWLTDSKVDRYATALRLILAQPDADKDEISRFISRYRDNLSVAGDAEKLLEVFDATRQAAEFSNSKAVREYAYVFEDILKGMQSHIETKTQVTGFGQKTSLGNIFDIIGLAMSLSYIEKLSSERLDLLVSLANNARSNSFDLDPDFLAAVDKVYVEDQALGLQALDIVRDFFISKGVDLTVDLGTKALAEQWSKWAFKKYGTRLVGHQIAGAASAVLIAFPVADLLFGREAVYENTVLTDYEGKITQQFQKYGKLLRESKSYSPINYNAADAETYRQIAVFANLASAQVQLGYANMLSSARVIKWAWDAISGGEWTQGEQLLREAAQRADEKTLEILERPQVIEEAIVRAITRARMGSQTVAPSATVLAIDISGSMNEADLSGGTKMEASKRAIENFLRMIRIENQVLQNNNLVSLVTFTNEADLLAALSPDINSMSAPIRGLSPQEGTNMAAGLQLANQQLSTQTSTTKRIIILLSDGIPTISLDQAIQATNRSAYQQIIEEVLKVPVAEAASLGHCIYTIGLGDPNQATQLDDGATLPQLDEALLRQISQGAGCGEYFNATDASQLVKLYVKLRHASVGQVLAEADGTITQNQTSAPIAFTVAPSQDQLVASVDWPGSKVELVITDPNGHVVDNAYPNTQIIQQDTVEFMVVGNPIQGHWKLSVYGRDVPIGPENYYAVVSSRGAKVVAPVPLVPEMPQGFGSAPLAFVLAIVGAVGITGYVVIKKSKKTRRSGSTVTSARLVALAGPIAGEAISLSTMFTIGRHSSCMLHIPDVRVSRQHATIRYFQNQWFIQDQGSRSGTYVNGQRVRAARLSSGDQITVGDSTFQFLL